jgi:hypothetical protein
LLDIPNHEGWGEVVMTTRNVNEKPREITAFTLRISGNSITGAVREHIKVDFQNFRKGMRLFATDLFLEHD